MNRDNTNAVGFGGMLGFFNTLFIAIGVCTYTHDGVGIGIVVFMFGIIPGVDHRHVARSIRERDRRSSTCGCGA